MSLLRSIDRLIQNYEPVKLFFLSQQASTDTQRLLTSFFNNKEGLCIFYFLQNVLFEIQKAELQLQRLYATVVDLHFIITNIINKLQEKLSDRYYGNNTGLILNQLKEIDATKSEDLMKAFDLFINQVVDYIKSYFNDNIQFYEKLSFFSAHSFNFLTWKNVIDVADIIHIDNLDIDQLYSEFCDIKCLYDNLKKKNVKLSDQVKSYISNKTNEFYTSNTCNQNVAYEDSNDKEILSSSDKKDEDFIRSDELWAYLLNINPNAAPNLTQMICYIFSMPCSNSFVEFIFINMKHCCNDYCNRMDIELIGSELKIRMNSNYSCG